jgi:hypothetical protein
VEVVEVVARRARSVVRRCIVGATIEEVVSMWDWDGISYLRYGFNTKNSACQSRARWRCSIDSPFVIDKHWY